MTVFLYVMLFVCLLLHPSVSVMPLIITIIILIVMRNEIIIIVSHAVAIEMH